MTGVCTDSVWQSIETAPMNGEIVDLIEFGERSANCHYNYVLKRWERFWINRNGGISWIEVVQPTHWMPIPKPPRGPGIQSIHDL